MAMSPPKRMPLQDFAEKLIAGIAAVVKQAISEVDVNSLVQQSGAHVSEKAAVSQRDPLAVGEHSCQRLAICQPKVVRGDLSESPDQPLVARHEQLEEDNGVSSKLNAVVETWRLPSAEDILKPVEMPEQLNGNGKPMHRSMSTETKRFSFVQTTGSGMGECSVTPLQYMKDVREFFAIDFNDKYLKAGDATRVGEVVDLENRFGELDPSGSGFVSAEALLERVRPSDRTHLEEAYPEHAVHDMMKKAIIAVNNLIASHVGPPDLMSLETFVVLMLATYPQLEAQVGRKTAKFIMLVRDIFVKETLKSRIESVCRLDSRALGDGMRPMQRIEIYFEPIVATVILLNALVIGISVDNNPNWSGWIVFELLFTTFFTVEQVIKMSVSGMLEHMLGEDWGWNWFDLVLVFCAIGDAFINVTEDKTQRRGGNGFQLNGFRIIRFVRITRLIRLLHLKMFKELQLMVRGVFAGLRTLWWAIVLLLGIVYSFGLLMRQLMNPEDNADRSAACEKAILDGMMLDHSFFKDEADCNRGARILSIYDRMLFGSVSRSMLTIFNCFTDSCTAPDGTPLLWHIWDIHGVWIIILYVLLFIFVTFGVFNLILAIFVENTMSAARVTETRTTKRYLDHVRQAKKLQKLLIKICTTDGKNVRPSFSEVKGLRRFFWRSKDYDDLDEQHLEMRVNRNTFDRALEETDVRRLFEDLEVSMNSRNHLFDILDADGNGYLAVNELVDGILRLRGPTDKGDVVATGLMMRCLQRHVLRFEQAVLQNQHALQHILVSILSNAQGSLTLPPGSNRAARFSDPA